MLQFPAMSLGLEIEDDASPSSRRFLQATWAFVWLGVLLRVVTFALNFPLWGDEAFVAVNLDHAGLCRSASAARLRPDLPATLSLAGIDGRQDPGIFGVVAPAGPDAGSVGGVFLFAHIAGRVTRGAGRMLAVAIFAVAYYPIRHGAEVKQYSTDLLASLDLLALAIEWWQEHPAKSLALGTCGHAFPWRSGCRTRRCSWPAALAWGWRPRSGSATASGTLVPFAAL